MFLEFLYIVEGGDKDVQGVMVCLSRHYRDEVILIFLSLG